MISNWLFRADVHKSLFACDVSLLNKLFLLPFMLIFISYYFYLQTYNLIKLLCNQVALSFSCYVTVAYIAPVWFTWKLPEIYVTSSKHCVKKRYFHFNLISTMATKSFLFFVYFPALNIWTTFFYDSECTFNDFHEKQNTNYWYLN